MAKGHDIIERMLTATKAASAADLAQKLEVSRQVISTYRKRDHVPESWLWRLDNLGYDTKWILHGGETAEEADQGETDRPYRVMFIKPGHEDGMATRHPPVGVVVNATGIKLPIPHAIEHVLCLEIRPTLTDAGEMEPTGTGLPLSGDRLDRLGVSHDGARSLQTPDGVVIFDVNKTEQQFGAAYVIAFQGFLAAMRLVMGPGGLGFAPLFAETPIIPITTGPDGPTPCIVGRAAWIGKEL